MYRLRRVMMTRRMQNTVFAVAVFALLPGLAVATTHQVDMVNFAFDPESLSVEAGDTVLWINQSSTTHTTTSGNPSTCTPDGIWDSGSMAPDDSFTYDFDTPGEYPYFCTPHCGMGMTGNIHVRQPGCVQGVVTDTAGDTLAGIIVEAILNSVVEGADTTGIDGLYHIEPIPPGTYEIVASGPSYFPDTVSGVEITEGCLILNFELVPAGCVAGTVTDTAGDSLAGITVQAVLGSVVEGVDITDLEGWYYIEPIPSGTYTMIASAPGYFPDTIFDVEITTGGCLFLNFELFPAGCIAGTVTDASGDSLEGAVVQAILSSVVEGEDTTDSEGWYYIDPIPSGIYDAVASKDGYLPDTVTSIDVTVGCILVDFQLEPAGGGFLRGDASSVGTPGLGDGAVAMSDAIYILKHLYVPGTPLPQCYDALDLDDSGDIAMSDALYLLKFLYVPGAPAPPDPGPTDCGDDPTGDGLDCVEHWCG
jgi:plastocyanin